MTFWVDEMLSPRLAAWMTQEFGVTVRHARDLGMERGEERAGEALIEIGDAP